MSKQQVAILVDAGYFYKQGMEVLFGHGKSREESILQEAPAIKMLFEMAERIFKKPALRVYWYDAPPERDKMSQSQRDLGLCSGVKLRMGSLNGSGQQKGVDALIIKDMGELARNGAVDSMLLVSGDEDLRLAVEGAQCHGVKVVLLGVGEDGTASVGGSMAMEADGVERLAKADLAKVLSLKSRHGAHPAHHAAAQEPARGKKAQRKRGDKKAAPAAHPERAPQAATPPAHVPHVPHHPQPRHAPSAPPASPAPAALAPAHGAPQSLGNATPSEGDAKSKRRGHRGGARQKKALMQQQEAQRRLEQAQATERPSMPASAPAAMAPRPQSAPAARAAEPAQEPAATARRARSSYRDQPASVETRPAQPAASAALAEKPKEPKEPKERKAPARAKTVEGAAKPAAPAQSAPAPVKPAVKSRSIPMAPAQPSAEKRPAARKAASKKAPLSLDAILAQGAGPKPKSSPKG